MKIFKIIVMLITLALITYLIIRLCGPKRDNARIQNKATAAYDYCQKNGMNENLCVLVDYSVHSGLNRLYVWDFQQNKIIYECVVAHGSGHDEPRKAKPKFSNEENSWLSSLGKCRIAERYNGQFGIAYRLDGLEASNSNVRKRCVVLHAYSSVLPFQIYPFRSARSKGCVMVSPRSMKKIDAILQNETSVLLETFE